MGTIILLQKPDFFLDKDLEPTVTAAWVDFVKIGEARSKYNLGEELESFLVFTLMRLMQRPDLFSTTLALEYLKASTEYTGIKKERVLSEVGDVSLVLAGLYPERSQKLNVSPSYFSQMGRLAFSELADSLAERKRKSLSGLYRNVSSGFPFMTNVLLAARENKFNDGNPLIKKPGFLSPQ